MHTVSCATGSKCRAGWGWAKIRPAARCTCRGSKLSLRAKVDGRSRHRRIVGLVCDSVGSCRRETGQSFRGPPQVSRPSTGAFFRLHEETQSYDYQLLAWLGCRNLSIAGQPWRHRSSRGPGWWWKRKIAAAAAAGLISSLPRSRNWIHLPLLQLDRWLPSLLKKDTHFPSSPCEALSHCRRGLMLSQVSMLSQRCCWKRLLHLS